jgi:hypothetical protein
MGFYFSSLKIMRLTGCGQRAVSSGSALHLHDQRPAKDNAARHLSSQTPHQGAIASLNNLDQDVSAFSGFPWRTLAQTGSTSIGPFHGKYRCHVRGAGLRCYEVKSGNQMYIITARRITSGDVLK